MNAAALLKSQGWRGAGHSLHASDDSIGLARPLLVSRRDDNRGIGRKSHATSDQWWLAAFDEQLRSLDTSAKTSVVVRSSGAHTRLDMVARAGSSGRYAGANALYTCFVRGGMLDGTITAVSGASTSTSTEDGSGASTWADATPEVEGGRGGGEDGAAVPARAETKEERRARREERRRRKAEKRARKLASAETSDSSKSEGKKRKKDRKERTSTETKEERRARKEAKRRRREEREQQMKPEQG